MFERFTDAARLVVVKAQEEARLLAHDAIGPEHLLLGLLVDGERAASQALATFVSLEAVRSHVGVLSEGRGGSGLEGGGAAGFRFRRRARASIAPGRRYLRSPRWLKGAIQVAAGLVHSAGP